MQSVTFRAPSCVVTAMDEALNHLTGESRSDFLRNAMVDRLSKLGITVKDHD